MVFFHFAGDEIAFAGAFRCDPLIEFAHERLSEERDFGLASMSMKPWATDAALAIVFRVWLGFRAIADCGEPIAV